MNIAEEYESLLDEKIKSLDEHKHKELIDDVLDGRNYLEKYSIVNLTLEELREEANRDVADLLRKEIDFVENNFKT